VLFLTLLHSDTSTYNCFTTAVLAGGNNVLKLFDLLHTSIIILLLLYSPGVIICLCSFNSFSHIYKLFTIAVLAGGNNVLLL